MQTAGRVPRRLGTARWPFTRSAPVRGDAGRTAASCPTGNWPIQLIPYVLEMGFAHIEFLPLGRGVPFGPSWGYQISNFSATDRPLRRTRKI